MQTVIRKYRPQDRDAVCRLFITGTLEHIYPCFCNSVSSPPHLLVTVALCAAGYLLGSLPAALVFAGAWIALIYYCCRRYYSSYVQVKLQTDMKDISGSFLTRPDDCFMVAEAQVDGRPQIIGTLAIKTKDGGDGRQAELFRMSISSSCRRMGLGVRMAKAAIDFCEERGISELVLQTSSTQVAALNLYRKLGFCIMGSQASIYSHPWVLKVAKVTVIRMKMCLRTRHR